MKKILFLLMIAVLTLSTVAPVLAADVSTGVKIQSGGGTLPVVLAKWETPDDDPVTPMTQVNPPMVFGAEKPVTYFAVVTDAEDNGKLQQVWADVYHPEGNPLNGSFKYEVPMNLITDKFGAGLSAFDAAVKANIVKFAMGQDAVTVRETLNKCVAEVWSGGATLSYHQPAGDYRVDVVAKDWNGNDSVILSNMMNYVRGTGVEIDFTSVDYGSVAIGREKGLAGDRTFGTADKPTSGTSATPMRTSESFRTTWE
jgi:hypothetical protein